jgi:hypothetical protein
MGKERVAHQENLGVVDSLDLLSGCSGKEAGCSTRRNGQSGSHPKLGKFGLSLSGLKSAISHPLWSPCVGSLISSIEGE